MAFPQLNLPNAILATVLAVLYAVYRRSRPLSYRVPLPPGPKHRFLLGNLLEAPKEYGWLKYHEWAKEYDSDIIYLNMAGQHLVVLDTLEAVVELLERRSGIYSSRPRLPMVNELMGWEFAFGMIKYGETWRTLRKIAHHGFHPNVVKKYRPHELRAARRLLRRLMELSDTGRGIDEIRQFSAEIIMAVTYGLDVSDKNDPYVKLAEEGMQPFSRVSPGSYLVDAIPALKYIPEWFPGAKFKRNARQWKASTMRMVDVPFRDTRVNIMNGTARPSLVKDGFERMKNSADPAYTEDNLRRVAGSMYSAASDTTTAVVSWAIIGLLKNPECISKAQEELDSVLEPDQLPSFNDEESLPYIHAIVREALRWRDTVPTSLPHYIDDEDIYNGYRIPAGTIVVPNLWAILHDENRFPEPFKFNPDRYMEDGKLRTDILYPEDVAFGLGRRVCPGKHIAMPSIWIAIASILTVFDLVKPLDKSGNVIEPDDACVPGVILLPRQLHCIFRPRSSAARESVLSTAHEEYQFY